MRTKGEAEQSRKKQFFGDEPEDWYEEGKGDTMNEKELKQEFDKRFKVLNKIEKEVKKKLFDVFVQCYAENDFRCIYCNEKMSLSWGEEYSFSIDHVIPKSKGGLDTPDNLVFCCAECNFLKGNRDVDYFLNNLDRLKKRKLKREQFKARKSSKDDREREAFKQIFQMRKKDENKRISEKKN